VAYLFGFPLNFSLVLGLIGMEIFIIHASFVALSIQMMAGPLSIYYHFSDPAWYTVSSFWFQLMGRV